MNSKKLIIEGENLSRLISMLSEEFKQQEYQPLAGLYVLFGEKHYFRNNAQLMVSLIVNIKEISVCEINIVAGGGSAGFLGASDLGAEEHIINKVYKELEEICNSNGWRISKYS